MTIKVIVDNVATLTPVQSKALSNFFRDSIEGANKVTVNGSVVVPKTRSKEDDANLLQSFSGNMDEFKDSEAMHEHDEIDAAMDECEVEDSRPEIYGDSILTGTNEPELDSKGIPWDARIHAKNKAQGVNGQWKLGRHLSPDFVKKVLKELNVAAGRYLKKDFPALAKAMEAPPPPVAAVPPPPVATDEVEEEDKFLELIDYVSSSQEQGKLNRAQVAATLAKFKVPSLATLGTTHGNLIPKILTELKRIAKR